MITREFVSTVFIVHKNKVLLTWNKTTSNWVPLGGHIEKNELPCDSVIREAKEESGLDIELVDNYERSESNNLIQPVNIRIDHIRDDHKHINLAYFAIVKSGKLLEQSDEQTPLKWFSKQDLETENLFPNVKEWALEALNKLG